LVVHYREMFDAKHFNNQIFRNKWGADVTKIHEAGDRLGTTEDVLAAFVEFALQYPDEASDAAYCAFCMWNYVWTPSERTSELLGLLSKDVFDALGGGSYSQITAPSRARFLSTRLRHLGLTPAEITIGRFLLKNWTATVPELVAAIRVVTTTLSPVEEDLVGVLDQKWRGSMDSLLETVRLLQTSQEVVLRQ
jgi:hypothetical protein